MIAECSMAASVVSAPISMPSPGTLRIPRNSPTPRKSSTYGGVNSFCFIEGSRSVPPATIFTSPSCFAMRLRASSSVLGRSSWKLGRLTATSRGRASLRALSRRIQLVSHWSLAAKPQRPTMLAKFYWCGRIDGLGHLNPFHAFFGPQGRQDTLGSKRTLTQSDPTAW